MYDYIVCWQNKKGACNWRCFVSEIKAIRFQNALKNNSPKTYSNIAKIIPRV